MVAFSQGQHVYVSAAEDGWRLGEIKESISDGEKVQVVLDDGQIIDAKIEDVELGSTLAAEGLGEMLQLDVLNTPSLLHNLRVRHGRDQYYTMVRLLVSMSWNPYH